VAQVCNHPYLFSGVEPEPFVEGEHLVEASAKLATLDKLLRRLRARGARVLLYSQSTMMLDVLQDYLHLRRWTYERLDGSARAEERWAAAAAFQGAGPSSTEPRGEPRNCPRGEPPFVFLLSTRAGGVGLNLTGANTVIFYDADWNPQLDRQVPRCGRDAQPFPIGRRHGPSTQAVDRAHRLGQTRPVLVVRLFCAGTVEEVTRGRAVHAATHS